MQDLRSLSTTFGGQLRLVQLLCILGCYVCFVLWQVEAVMGMMQPLISAGQTMNPRC